MTIEAFKKLLELYGTLTELNGQELGEVNFDNEIQALKEVIVDEMATAAKQHGNA